MIVERVGSLTTLNVGGYKITDKGADMIVAVLMQTVSLALLDISNTTLNIANTEKINNALKFLASLRHIRLNNNDIDDKAADSMVAVILNNPLLEILDISDNKFSSTGLLKITNALLLSKHIKIFDISKNVITFDNIEKISAALLECPTLQELNLSENLLTLSGVLKIAQCFRHHCTLQTLDLSNNSVSFPSACEFIVDVILSVNAKLVNLNVCGRNIRPRFIEDYLSPPNNEKTVDKFTLQNLYLLQRVSQNTVYIQTKFIKAKTEPCPVFSEDIVSYYVDRIGGVFYNQYHNCTLVIPPNAVSQGECVEIQVTATHYGPYKIPNGFYPISSFFWISADYTFKVPVYAILSHYAKTSSKDTDHLYVLQTNVCDSVPSDNKLVMETVPKGVYFDCELGYCVLATDHFCSYCLAKDKRHIPDYFFASYYTYDNVSDGSHIAEVCFCPSIPECKKVNSCRNYPMAILYVCSTAKNICVVKPI